MDDEEQELEELERLSGELGDTRELPGSLKAMWPSGPIPGVTG